MTTTPQDIIESALGKIRIRATGQTIPNTILTQCLASLEELRELWALDNYTIYYYTEQSQSLAASDSDYSVGSGGDWDITRPQVIHPIAQIQDSGGEDHRVDWEPLQRYWNRTNKSDTGRPSKFTYNPGYPTGTLYVYPTPTEVETFKFKTLDELTAFSSLSQTLSLPPGYRTALVTNLALYVAPDFNKEPGRNLTRIAGISLSKLKSRNSQLVQPTELEVSQLSTGGMVGNILTGWE